MAIKSSWKKLLPVVLIAASALIGMTGATVLHNMKLENPIKTPPVTETIEEHLNKDTKEVTFENTGEADVFLRVAYTANWVVKNETDTADDDVILPNKLKTKNGTEFEIASPEWNIDNWNTEIGDGWWYYNKILAGKGSKDYANYNNVKLLEKVDFGDGTIDNNDEMKNNVEVAAAIDPRYKDAEYELHFTVEVVQASDEPAVSKAAVESLFTGRSFTENFESQTEDGRTLWTKPGKYTSTITWK